MSIEAVIMMIVAMLILWGGLAVAIVRLNRHEPPSLDEIHRDL
ncbi:MAG: methionine/alanine import family NSS transporter small subunit [Actinomycetota bacterium]|nr:methionine/alanine import family NSS transporter small subunit [Actinomycetota bacterium]